MKEKSFRKKCYKETKVGTSGLRWVVGMCLIDFYRVLGMCSPWKSFKEKHRGYTYHAILHFIGYVRIHNRYVIC